MLIETEEQLLKTIKHIDLKGKIYILQKNSSDSLDFEIIAQK